MKARKYSVPVFVLVILCLAVAALMIYWPERKGGDPIPQVINSPTVENNATPTTPQLSVPTATPNATTPQSMEVLVPDQYVRTGVLPVYAAEERDFGAIIDPKWFNQSGTVSQKDHMVDFVDGGALHWSRSAIFYNTYDGTYEATSVYANGSTFTETLKKPTMSSHASDLASRMLSGFPGTKEIYDLERTELTHITLVEAKAMAEQLMRRLGMAGYTCTAAIDMSMERIIQMGGLLMQAIENGKYGGNAYRYDYTTVTVEDEGYHLQYHKFGTDGDLAGEHMASFYVTARGIMSASLRERYTTGALLETPERLINEEEAVALLPNALAVSPWPETLLAVSRATLTWMPCADDGTMVMYPIWMLSYITEDSAQKGANCWAAFDAVTGKLCAAIFRE